MPSAPAPRPATDSDSGVTRQCEYTYKPDRGPLAAPLPLLATCGGGPRTIAPPQAVPLTGLAEMADPTQHACAASSSSFLPLQRSASSGSSKARPPWRQRQTFDFRHPVSAGGPRSPESKGYPSKRSPTVHLSRLGRGPPQSRPSAPQVGRSRKEDRAAGCASLYSHPAAPAGDEADDPDTVPVSPRLAANKAGESPAQHSWAAPQGPQRAALDGVGPRTPGNAAAA